ncbi:acyl-CoA acyltransferase [bacterium]|jgi:ribosomal protein S18 acetylase RimI-like enzyme|nr:acyl-CoA acyltransferase [bacterium]
MNIKIRKATEDDAPLLAQSMLESSRSGKKKGIFDMIFATSDKEELLVLLEKLAKTQTKSYCHFSNFLVASVDGVDAGFLCGYEPRLATHEIFTKAMEELGFDESYQERLSSYLLVKPEFDKKTFLLDFMAVKDEFHEFSVLKELVQKSLLTARLKGYRIVQTMVEIGAVETILVYKKLGFTVIDERRNSYYEAEYGRAGIVRLQMQL